MEILLMLILQDLPNYDKIIKYKVMKAYRDLGHLFDVFNLISIFQWHHPSSNTLTRCLNRSIF